jgi:hypothetical protein
MTLAEFLILYVLARSKFLSWALKAFTPLKLSPVSGDLLNGNHVASQVVQELQRYPAP